METTYISATGTLSVAERSYPTSEVRSRSPEDPMPKGGGQDKSSHVRGATPHPRSSGCAGTGGPRGAIPL